MMYFYWSYYNYAVFYVVFAFFVVDFARTVLVTLGSGSLIVVIHQKFVFLPYYLVPYYLGLVVLLALRVSFAVYVHYAIVYEFPAFRWGPIGFVDAMLFCGAFVLLW